MEWGGLVKDRFGSRSGMDGASASSSPAPSSADFPLPSFSSSRKPASAAASGLSKPRLVKVRKHLGSARVRPSVNLAADDDPGFNPFRSESSNAEAADAERKDGGDLQGLRENLREWKPFVPEAAGVVRGSSNLPIFRFGISSVQHSDNNAFVFGSATSKRSESGGIFSGYPLKSESVGHDSVSGTRKTIGSESAAYQVFGIGTDRSVDTTDNMFVFVTSANSSSNSGGSSRKDGTCNNVRSSRSLKHEIEGFLSGATSTPNLSTVDSWPGNNKKSNEYSGPFVFGSGTRKGSSSYQSSPELSFTPNLESGIGQSSCAAFVSGVGTMEGDAPSYSGDRTEYNDVGISIDIIGLNKGDKSSSDVQKSSGQPTLNSFRSANSQSSHFPFGNFERKDIGSSNVLGGFSNIGNENSNATTFVFGSGVSVSSNMSHSQEDSLSKLPVQMENLKLQGSGCQDYSVKTKKADDKNSFSNIKTSSAISDESSYTGLAANMQKLNMHSSIDGNKPEKAKQPDQSDKANKHYAFVFGTNQSAPSLFSDPVLHKLPEEMHKLNIGSDHSSQATGKKCSDYFVFRCDMSQTSNQMSKTSLSSSGKNSSEFSGDIENSCSLKAADTITTDDYPFKLGLSHGTDNRSVDDRLNPDTKNLKIESETENPSGSSKRANHEAPTPVIFTFQAGQQDTNSTIDGNKPFKSPDGFMAQNVTTPPNPSSLPSGSQTDGTYLNFISMCEGPEMHYMKFRSSKQFTPEITKESLFHGLNKNAVSDIKKGESRAARTRKIRGKLKPNLLQKNFTQPFASAGKEFETTEPKSPSSYSPMDCSPYQEAIVNESSRETSLAHEEFDHIFSCSTSGNSNSIDEREENLVSATLHLEVSEDESKHDKVEIPDSRDHIEREDCTQYKFIDEKQPAPYLEDFFGGSVNLNLASDSTPMEANANSLGQIFGPQASKDKAFFTFSSSIESIEESSSTFAQSPFTRGSVSALKHHRKKSWRKGVIGSSNSVKSADAPLGAMGPNLIPVSSTSLQSQGMPSIPLGGYGDAAETDKGQGSRRNPTPTDAEVVAEQEVCEKWRLRGNQVYQEGKIAKALEYYTRGMNSVSHSVLPRSSNSNRSLMLCYSNRAAALMSLGRMRDALSDCQMASAVDPSFMRAQVRAANCYLSLGEIEDAVQLFKKCLNSDNKEGFDQKILAEASDGLQRAQQVSNYMVQSEELLLKRKSDEAEAALRIISVALSISPHSERVMEKKANALLLLQRYDEVIQFCQQTMEGAEKNSAPTNVNLQSENTNVSERISRSAANFWRWLLMAKSYFCQGKLEEALEMLKKQEMNAKSDGNNPSESCMSLSITIHELLRLKASGNDAFQAGRYLEAIEHYSAAIACSTESRHFTAICFCNRAAAYQAVGQITDAIADCSLAIAFNASYAKALSRRATLHEAIRDYGQAASDLKRLISLLEAQLKDQAYRSGGKPIHGGNDLNQARMRLAAIEEAAKKETDLNMYLILGVEPSSSAADIKKAYRKAALRHHPDKAGQILARSENLDDSLLREIADKIHSDADRLFKMIGEAYNVLSDPSKRLQYEAEEEMGTTKRKGYSTAGTSKYSENSYGSKFDRSFNRHHPRAYESSNRKWSYY